MWVRRNPRSCWGDGSDSGDRQGGCVWVRPAVTSLQPLNSLGIFVFEAVTKPLRARYGALHFCKGERDCRLARVLPAPGKLERKTLLMEGWTR